MNRIAIVLLAIFAGCAAQTVAKKSPFYNEQRCLKCGEVWEVASTAPIPSTVEWCFNDGNFCETGMDFVKRAALLIRNGASQDEIDKLDTDFYEHCKTCDGCKCASYTPETWQKEVAIREPQIKAIAFDCFGTVFKMSSALDEDIAAYVKHVKADNFSPYEFPKSWYELKAHPDSAEGIRKLQAMGFKCIALSNGSVDLISRISEANGIKWDSIIDLASHHVYKPKLDAYRAVEQDTGFKPQNTLMVTANPTFGDVEGSQAIGMKAQVIRRAGDPETIVELADKLSKVK